MLPRALYVNEAGRTGGAGGPTDWPPLLRPPRELGQRKAFGRGARWGTAAEGQCSPREGALFKASAARQRSLPGKRWRVSDPRELVQRAAGKLTEAIGRQADRVGVLCHR